MHFETTKFSPILNFKCSAIFAYQRNCMPALYQEILQSCLIFLYDLSLIKHTKMRSSAFFTRSGTHIFSHRVHKYAKFGVLYSKIFKMTPPRLQRERVTLTPQSFGCKIVFSLPFSKQIQSTLTANVTTLI